MYYLEFKKEGSNKFWKLVQEGNSFTVTYGKIGMVGTSSIKTFESEEKAKKEAEKLVASKRKKGYVDAEQPKDLPKVKTRNPMEVKKPKVKTLELGPEPLRDDGKSKPWHDWDEVLEEDFEVSNMRMGVSTEKASKGVVNDNSTYNLENLMRTHMGHKFIKSKIDLEKLFLCLCQKGNYEEATYVYEAVGISNATIRVAIKQVFESKKHTPILYPETFVMVEWFYHVLGETFDQFLGLISEKDISVDIIEIYYMNLKDTKDFNEAKTQTLRIVEDICKSSVPMIIEAICNICNYARQRTEFKADNIEKLNQLIKGNRFVKNTYGFSLAFENNKLYVGILGSNTEGTSGISMPLSLKGVSSKFIMEMICEDLKVEVEKLWKSNVFEGLFKYQCVIRECAAKEDLLYKEMPSKEREELLKRLHHLETNNDWKENIKSLADIVDECKKETYMPYDEKRILELVLKYMKAPVRSVRDDAEVILEEEAKRKKASDIWVEAAVISYCNDGHFKTAKSRYIDKPEKRINPELEHKLRKLIDVRKKSNHVLMANANSASATVTEETIDNDYVLFGYGSKAEDTFLETKNVVIRADENGMIMIRFLIEGEEAYGEALDFVNNLLQKGYGRIGHYFCVRFLYKPIAIKQVEKMVKSYEITYPFNDTHAFFARAVQYPALRSKVERYAYLTLKKYDWYPDLDGEENTVPGTFAATALAFCGLEYMPIVIHYAHMVDGDHSNLHVILPRALIKHYGMVPEIAPAIFALCMANGQDYEYHIPAGFLAKQEVAKYIMEDIHNWDTDENEKLIYFEIAAETILCRSLYNSYGRDNLTKIRKYINNSEDIETKGGLIEFYNYYLKVVKYDHNGDLTNMKPIIQIDGYSSTKKSGKVTNSEYVNDNINATQELQKIKETGTVIMSMEEAKKASVDFSDAHENEALDAFFYLHPIQDDIELLNYFNETALELGYENHSRTIRRCDTVWMVGSGIISNGQWVVDTTHLGASAATILFNGKERPVILYGYLDFIDTVIEFKENSPKGDEAIEKLRLNHLKREARTHQYDKEYEEAGTLLEPVMEQITYGSFFAAEHAIQKLESNNNKYVKLASKVAMVQVLQRGGRVEGLASLCDDLAKLQSEKRDYWLAKKVVAERLQKHL